MEGVRVCARNEVNACALEPCGAGMGASLIVGDGSAACGRSVMSDIAGRRDVQRPEFKSELVVWALRGSLPLRAVAGRQRIVR